MSASNHAFLEKVEQLLKSDIIPPRMEKVDGSNSSRVSASTKEKCRVLEGEMGRLSQEVTQLKKLRESLMTVKVKLDNERDEIEDAASAVTEVLFMIDNSRTQLRDNLIQIDVVESAKQKRIGCTSQNSGFSSK